MAALYGLQPTARTRRCLFCRGTGSYHRDKWSGQSTCPNCTGAGTVAIPEHYVAGFKAGTALNRMSIDGFSDQKKYTTGLPEFDAKFNGFYAGEYALIAARTNGGKTAFAEHLALNISLQHKVMLFALEDKQTTTEDHLLMKIFRWDEKHIEHMKKYDVEKLQGALQSLRKHDLVLDCMDIDRQHTLDEIIEKVEIEDPAVVIIDHLRVLQEFDSSPGERSDLAPGRVSRRLRSYASETNRTVIAFTQLRDPQNKSAKEKPPSIDDIADSRRIAQTADSVVCLYMQGEFVSLRIEKNRHGQSKVNADARWDGPTRSYLPATE